MICISLFGELTFIALLSMYKSVEPT